ncbi:MAG: TolC family protein [Thermoanaerobaculia bacterium]
MLPVRTPWLSLPLLVLLARPAAGQESTRLFTTEIDPLLEESLRANPEAVSLREGIAAARARIGPAGAIADPTATITYQNGGYAPSLGSNDDTFLGVTVEQPLPVFGRTRLASTIAARSADEVALTLMRLRLNLEAELRRTYTDLVLARALIGLISDQERTWGEIEAATRARYSAGMGEQQDVLRAQAERTRLVPMRVHEQGNEEAALAELNRLLGRPIDTPLPTPRSLMDLAATARLPDRDQLLSLAEEKSPELQQAALAQERARLRVELARRMLKPDVSVMGSYMNRGALPPMWAVGLGVSLPVHANRRQRPAIFEAESRGREEAASREAQRRAVRVAVEKEYAAWKGAMNEAVPYASGVLVQDRLAVEAARASYESGRVPFVSMLEALNTLFGDLRTYNETLAHVLWHEAAAYRFLPAERIAPRASMGG